MRHQREKELIFAAAASPFKAADINRLLDGAAELDWQYILETAGRHGVAQLLYQMIMIAGAGNRVPGKAVETLQRSYLAALMNNQGLYLTLFSVLEAFEANSIPVILLKGAALCQTIYADMGLRPFGDLDILVHKEDVPRCQRLLQDLGFKLIPNNYFPIPDDQNDELGCEWSYHLDGRVVELHWGLIDSLSPFEIDIDRFWDDAVEIEINGHKALAMNPENQIAHLCLHQYKHVWEHLRDLTDVSLVLYKYKDEIDWRHLVANSHAQGFNRCIYFTLDLAHQVLGAALPFPMTPLLGKKEPGGLTKGLRNLIAHNLLETHQPRRIWSLLLINGRGKQLVQLKRTIAHPFPRDDWPLETVPADDVSGGNNKIAAALKSVYYYRKLVFQFPGHLIAALRERNGRR